MFEDSRGVRDMGSLAGENGQIIAAPADGVVGAANLSASLSSARRNGLEILLEWACSGRWASVKERNVW
jgi:hypothetical protein